MFQRFQSNSNFAVKCLLNLNRTEIMQKNILTRRYSYSVLYYNYNLDGPYKKVISSPVISRSQYLLQKCQIILPNTFRNIGNTSCYQTLSYHKRLQGSVQFLNNKNIETSRRYNNTNRTDTGLAQHTGKSFENNVHNNRDSQGAVSNSLTSQYDDNGCEGTTKEDNTSQQRVKFNPDFDVNLTEPQKFVRGCPANVRPYLHLMRLDRPIGTWLLFWPCGWGISLAAGVGHLPDPWLLAVFATGSLVMRGAGCTLNDMWDRKYDAKVSRTQDRPLANGSVTPFDGLVFLGAQLGVGLLVLLQLSLEAILLGASSLVLVCGYPLAKRVTYWPQLVLGLTFNWGTLLGYCAVHGSIMNLSVMSLYTAGVAWTLIYDTIYAHQDKGDDLQIGVKSTALMFGDNTAPWLGAFSGVMLSCLLVTGYSAGLGWPYYGAVAGTAAHLAYQIHSLDINSPAQCGRQFRQHRHVGLLLFLGLVSGSYLGTPEQDKDLSSSTNKEVDFTTQSIKMLPIPS